METQLVTYLFGAGVLAIALVTVFRATFFTVQQRTVAIVQRLGKFVREAAPGIQVKIPFIDRVVGLLTPGNVGELIALEAAGREAKKAQGSVGR